MLDRAVLGDDGSRRLFVADTCVLWQSVYLSMGCDRTVVLDD
jgi:hypothetical protein